MLSCGADCCCETTLKVFRAIFCCECNPSSWPCCNITAKDCRECCHCCVDELCTIPVACFYICAAFCCPSCLRAKYKANKEESEKRNNDLSEQINNDLSEEISRESINNISHP